MERYLTILLILALSSQACSAEETSWRDLEATSEEKQVINLKFYPTICTKSPERCLFVRRMGSLSTSEAELVATFPGKFISLDNVEEVSPAAIVELAKWRGNSLSIVNMVELDQLTAANLSKWKGKELYLDGLRVLPEKVIKALTKNSTLTTLSFNRVETIKGNTAYALAAWKGQRLYLNGLKSIRGRPASVIATWKGQHLALNGLTKITALTARHLKRFSGRIIELNNVQIDTLDTLELIVLTQSTKVLNLSRLPKLPQKSARKLLKWDGKSLILSKLTTLSSKAAASIAQIKTKNIDLSGVKKISPQALKQLSKWKGITINLSGLKNLSKQQARALAQFKVRTLQLNGLTKLPLPVFSELMRWPGWTLELNKIKYLTPEHGEIISSWPGSGIETNLHLENLTKLDDATAVLFATWRGKGGYLFVHCPRLTLKNLSRVHKLPIWTRSSTQISPSFKTVLAKLKTRKGKTDKGRLKVLAKYAKEEGKTLEQLLQGIMDNYLGQQGFQTHTHLDDERELGLID
ncbi:MAG: hypothetical protein VYA34_07960 [Myxococcota bacterium]|nr:hypothetical protein [Myxococcota bacterium]